MHQVFLLNASYIKKLYKEGIEAVSVCWVLYCKLDLLLVLLLLTTQISGGLDQACGSSIGHYASNK